MKNIINLNKPITGKNNKQNANEGVKVEFAQLNPEVSKTVIEKIPEVVDLGKEAINKESDVHNRMMESNDKRSGDFYKISEKMIDNYRDCINNPESTPEDRKYYSDKMDKIYDRVCENEKEERTFLGDESLKSYKATSIIFGLGALAAGVLSGTITAVILKKSA